MKIRITVGLSILLTLWSGSLFADQNNNEQLLMGKGEPELFGEDIRLRKEAYDAFQEMRLEALEDGILLQGVSGYRSLERQRAIWNRKYELFTGTEKLSPIDAINKIITYSSLPGTSRHHWGTEIDLIDGNAPVAADENPLQPEKFHDPGPFADMKRWLDKHAHRFGFFLVYTRDPNRKGFFYEPWHYSYKPLSKPLLHHYLKSNIKNMVPAEKLLGHEFVTEDFLNKYWEENILDINPLVK